MSKQTEAMKLALEVLETVARQPVGKGTVDAITALQEALAEQPEPVQQEPVAGAQGFGESPANALTIRKGGVA